ncbi:hypothetical protein [Polynucleobacter sp. MWH-UH2A]|uniref:hypothetical protein n=1 Tax=Polynucleobacter sp. MWH-UH2A TaxID=1855617 RepID=UPI001BFE4B75|nr:hypothetical protein [Polynucleobacter sp. MWH-UH2A]QWD63371.1 hypothetical protein IC571_06630 [Polynucleobacter sp. MWH-UH2A]
MSQALTKEFDISHKKRPKGYLALRVGGKGSDINHPITEIDAVLKSKGFAYFAKFGKSVGRIRGEKLLAKTEPYLVILCFNGGKYDSKTYKLLELTKSQPKNASHYPKYYKDKLAFVGSWLKIEPSDLQVNVDSLIVTSSYQKLSKVMGSAMGSCFFCTTNS